MSSKKSNFAEGGLYQTPLVEIFSVMAESDILVNSPAYGGNCEPGSTMEESEDNTWNF